MFIKVFDGLQWSIEKNVSSQINQIFLSPKFFQRYNLQVSRKLTSFICASMIYVIENVEASDPLMHLICDMSLLKIKKCSVKLKETCESR